ADPFLANYDNGAAFELVYTAKDPLVLGVGFAATRDLISFLRNDTTNANPAKGAVRYTLAHGQSQSGRYIKGFIHLGFNADEQNRMVFDGVNPLISGAHDIATNERWGDANATGRKYQRHTIAKQEFPFTYEVRKDPVGGQTEGIFLRCQVNSSCPKIAHIDSGNEAYLKPTFLVTSDGIGNDIALPANVRVYDIGSTQHAPASTITTTPASVCQQPGNPNQWARYVRALFVGLDLWTTAGVEPPASAYAKASDGTAVPTPQNFPQIPGVRYTGWVNPVAVLDKSQLPYTPIAGKEYVTYVPKVDADGNDLPGVRTVNVQAPLATYTGWGLRRAGFAENEDCGLTGQYIPFAKTKAERLASGDPRLSLEERYGNLSYYLWLRLNAVNDLVNRRYLLPEDAFAEYTSGAAAARARGLNAVDSDESQ
ncbi:MAG: alpha/beta hydrolase domain-containing protein, partial [Pseudomonadota bacterium]|nr:alpha/beta hydrolase domain-containing protein [Pseudomonadota bacterium]